MENVNALDEINKGTTMGMESIKLILNKVENKSFKKVLDTEYKKYEKIAKRISEIYPKYSDKLPQKINTMNKVMTWSGIEMQSMIDKSDSKLAELLVQGTNMGIIEGRKILNNKELNEEVKSLISEFVTMQEDSVETLKQYL